MQIAEIGSFHVGGRLVSLRGLPSRRVVLTQGAPEREFSADGEFISGQMYVQFVRLAAPRARFPLLLWHGGGMTGVTWETKPDGMPGWQSYFLNAGHDVYVSDAVERGRASWSRYPEIYPEPPHMRSMREAWELFRFGPPGSWSADPSSRRPYPGTLFPVETFDQFASQIVPRWACNDVLTQGAYDALVQRVGPCVIMTHSQGGAFGFNAALHAPDLVKGVIAIEPSGAPPAAEVAAVRDVPHLLLLGDYMTADPFWSALLPNVRRHFAAISQAGGNADVMDLPAHGITGNTHFPMMDRNSDAVAGMVQGWMEARGLMR